MRRQDGSNIEACITFGGKRRIHLTPPVLFGQPGPFYEPLEECRIGSETTARLIVNSFNPTTKICNVTVETYRMNNDADCLPIETITGSYTNVNECAYFWFSNVATTGAQHLSDPFNTFASVYKSTTTANASSIANFSVQLRC
jgi:hypothetical protein